jgi:glycine/D-amino acid oxidase-like deaminating enzyme
LGGKIYEGTLVTRIVPGNSEHGPRVITTHGTVTARYVVRATEGFTSTLPGQRRELAPIYSLMIASSVQSSGFWKSVGLTKHETFSDGRHLLVYGQRTADNRFAFGGRGAPYHFGSTVEERFDNNQRVFDLLEQTLRELFPTLEGSRTHQWGGALAMPRDLSPSVHVDHVSGLVTAGGYTGDGVVLSFVSGHAIADLLTNPEKKTEMTRLPFVQRRSRQWEPEPLRWIGVNAGIALATRADATEQRRKRESRITPLLDRLFDQDLD